jgi:hypothetical protein
MSCILFSICENMVLQNNTIIYTHPVLQYNIAILTIVFVYVFCVGSAVTHRMYYSLPRLTTFSFPLSYKTNIYTNYSFSLLIMYGSSYMFWHYIAILREHS